MWPHRLLEAWPVPYVLYEKCVELEERELACGRGRAGVGKLRDLYERAVRDYGETRVGQWPVL